MAFYIVVWIVVWCILVAEWQREFPEDGPAGGYYWASFGALVWPAIVVFLGPGYVLAKLKERKAAPAPGEGREDGGS